MLQQHGFTEHCVLPVKSCAGFLLGPFLVTPIAVSALSIILMYINVSKRDTTLERKGGISFFGFGASGALRAVCPLGRLVLPSKKRCFNEIKISIFDGHLSCIYINVPKRATTLERNGGISFFGFGALGALRGVCLSGGPFYLVKNGVSCKSRFRSSMII